MANVNFVNAASAYGKAAQGGMGIDARDSAGPSFASTLGNVINDGLNVIKQSESKAISGVKGGADLTDVITAISKAEIMLQEVVAVRDKVIAGYQEIMRMPI